MGSHQEDEIPVDRQAGIAYVNMHEMPAKAVGLRSLSGSITCRMMRMTKFLLGWAILAIGPAVFTGCISFQGDAVTALPEDKHSLSDPKGKPAPKINRLLTAKEIFNKSVDAEKRRKSKAEDGIIYDFQRKVENMKNEISGKKIVTTAKGNT